ncbi:MAG: hypothetical protein HDS13_06835 [Bacteroides sp.]|nr:hypothetical protein [Bacteroides sp.]
MVFNLPPDIRIEALLNYFPQDKVSVNLCGLHKRNAYKDITNIEIDEKGIIDLSVARQGMYDVLPEALFHPIDRFEDITANEYKERFQEEYEQQQIEENNARNFFRSFDRFIISLNRIIANIKDSYSDTGVISEIIGDRLTEDYLSNRFIRKALKFLPVCRDIRGDKTIITLILRNILLDENLLLATENINFTVKDNNPRYNYCLDTTVTEDKETYLGNEFDEEIITFNIAYWNDEECTDSFLKFINEMDIFEQFINDYFVSIESAVKFNIATDTLSVRISDEHYYNYLDYNTNI